jgi:hypothetical protein
MRRRVPEHNSSETNLAVSTVNSYCYTAGRTWSTFGSAQRSRDPPGDQALPDAEQLKGASTGGDVGRDQCPMPVAVQCREQIAERLIQDALRGRASGSASTRSRFSASQQAYVPLSVSP